MCIFGKCFEWVNMKIRYGKDMGVFEIEFLIDNYIIFMFDIYYISMKYVW